MAHLGLALVFLCSARESDFYELFDAISPAKLRSQASSVRAAAYLVHGLHYFLHARLQECKSAERGGGGGKQRDISKKNPRKQLMDSIAISKEEDMARAQSMALLLLAKLLGSKCDRGE